MKKEFTALLAASSLCLCAGEIRVALVGSSACQSYHSSDPRLICGWGEVIGKYFQSHVKILNFAISGYSSKMFLDRGEWEKVKQSKPHYVLITIGANDSKPGKFRYTDPDTGYRTNILRFVRETREMGAEPVLVTLNQAMKLDNNGKCVFFNGKAFRKDREPYNRVMREIAAAEHVPCVDLARSHQAALEQMGEAEAGKLYRLFDLQEKKIDPSHTNRDGAERIAKLIVDGLARTDSPLKKELRTSELQRED